MSLDVTGITAALESHAATLGQFERVNLHEPKNAPSNGLTLAIWVQRTRPLPEASGLMATTSLVVFHARIYTNMLAEPQDMIDPQVLAAVDALAAVYSADFTLGGLVRNVDLLGAHSDGLSSEAGYLTIANQMMRTVTLQVPLIVNDLWSQSA